MIQAMARRVGGEDLAEFGAVWEVMTESERAAVNAIDGLRSAGFSWTEIAGEVGWTKQRLQQWRDRRGEIHRQRNVDARQAVTT
jgi:hypothetical protein